MLFIIINMSYNKISVAELEKHLNSLKMNNYEIFREYEKDKNKFLATDNIFVSENSNNLENKKYIKICGRNNEKFIEKNNEVYIIHYDISYNEKSINKKTKEISLMIIKNIDLELNTDLIDIKELLKDNMNNNECDELIQDLYFNNYYYQKFNSNKLSNNNTTKKYFFKLKRGEINMKHQLEQRCIKK
jgi:hypothetical protein